MINKVEKCVVAVVCTGCPKRRPLVFDRPYRVPEVDYRQK